MNYSALIESGKLYIEAYSSTHPCGYVFHNNTHMQDVVEATQRMSTFYKLSEKDHAIVLLAAYFHDTGYLTGGAQDHELRSAELAEKFLVAQPVSEDFRKMVSACILATKVPQNPQNLLEQIICDADLFHLGLDSFPARNKLMRKEAEWTSRATISKEEWRKSTIKFLQDQHYHTEFAQTLLKDKKEAHLQKLIAKEMTERVEVAPKEEIVTTKKKKKEEAIPARGIETMFRITSANNQRLSDMADGKANILITVNSIILSMIIALLLRKLDNNEHLLLPTIILLAMSLCTMIAAILATRPKIPNGYYTPEDIKEKRVNLLFFGNFFNMNLETYNEGMKSVMQDRDFLYSTLIKDVYSQGVVLGRKYKLLRLAYNIFMFGLIISVAAFLVAVVIL